MARADEFRALAQECAASYDERMAALASIKKEVTELMDTIRVEISEIKDTTHAMLKEFHKEQEEAAAAWRDLVSKMRSKREGVRPPMARA